MGMLCGKKVCVRTRQSFAGENVWVYLGKVMDVSDTYVYIETRGLVVREGEILHGTMDEELRPIIVPWSTIASLRILPDDFDLDDIETFVKAPHIGVRVKDAPPAWIGEIVAP